MWTSDDNAAYDLTLDGSANLKQHDKYESAGSRIRLIQVYHLYTRPLGYEITLIHF
ncbi:hypothetical protein ACVPOW_13840 [Staphylococcus aureus]